MKKDERDYRDGPSAATDADELETEVDTRVTAVDETSHGERLDKLLVRMAPEFSRSHLQGLIRCEHVRVDARVQTSASSRLRLGQLVELQLVPTEESRAFRAEPIPLSIVFEDEHVIVLDKPAGLVVHPAAGNWSGTLLNALLAHHAGAASLPRAGIVHRLDKDTSGLMVVAKNLPSMNSLVRAIAAREVQREYLAMVHGDFPVQALSIEAPIGRDPRSRVRMAIVAGGKPARTDVNRIATHGGFTAMRCRLHTGRTHQIRVHLAYKGHPLVADSLYGGRPALGLERQALHAAALRFSHPAHGGLLAFDAPLPSDLTAAWVAVLGT